MLVLEPTFNAEAMATALGIPSGKHILRRHLAEEMSAVFPPARCVWAPGRAALTSRPGPSLTGSHVSLVTRWSVSPIRKPGLGEVMFSPNIVDQKEGERVGSGVKL